MPRHPERMAKAGLINRRGEVFFHLLTLLGSQHLADVEMAIRVLRKRVFTMSYPSGK
ncbi:hypothetical protein KR869_12495 [Klebsiella quasipneumoniae subsp. similipneumoniae]|uniref:hypothetical protein n=1 Tax=Klebsiella quasipneumoniae TaxID=1463165 RepID=UPI00217DFEEA|nr:hypothetical protein [Klebsiella quasipneumoniae]MCS6398571.1 hypothetical protein [Klebsiella quasipneumoniae subsp. similipneumoniae]